MKFLITLWCCLVSTLAVAQIGGGPLTIRITQGVEGALPLAIVRRTAVNGAES